MKYNAYVKSKLKSLGYFYKKIYAGGTNTDVSVPLLLNAKTDPRKLTLENQTNLFRLAKKNGFHTTFFSLQSEKALEYIKPFLQTTYIDNYKSFDKKSRKPKYDFLLLDLLKDIDFSQNNFIVLQQIGEHSPYKYFDGKKSSDLRTNYKRSVDYSFELFKKIDKFLKDTKKPFILVFTSDHGEFTGEDERWGHNAFEKTIYEVPFFSNIELSQIRSHEDLSQYLIYALGYKKEFLLNSKKAIINGTMQSREDGFIEVVY
jgi:glucan phosphoethanolaminetransferase (alkaline phosphatase superfamily)